MTQLVPIKPFLHLITLIILLCCCSGNDSNKTDRTKLRQYYIKGEQLFLTHCSNCHQKDGSGLGLLYPPLDTSDYMDKNSKEVICLIKNGIQGEILVNGKSFNKSMPGIPALTDIEVAEICTYIYNSWSHSRGLIDVKEVTSALSNCPR